jgi:hypothetical protein
MSGTTQVFDKILPFAALVSSLSFLAFVALSG